MNRRLFLGAIGSVIAGATLDPERLLWRPGAKLVSIPKAPLIIIDELPHWYDTTVTYFKRDGIVWFQSDNQEPIPTSYTSLPFVVWGIPLP